MACCAAPLHHVALVYQPGDIRCCKGDSTFHILQLRLQGNAEARGGDLKAAEQAYSKGLALDTPRGKHLLHANRSGVRLSSGNAEGALEDAQAAVNLAPAGFATAHVRLVSSFTSATA